MRHGFAGEGASVHLHLPGLYPGDARSVVPDARLAAELVSGLELSNFDRLLRRARVETAQPDAPGSHTAEDRLLDFFTLTYRPDAKGPDCPVGPLTYALDCGEPPPSWCYRADPVFMEAGLRDVAMYPGEVLQLSDEDADLLITALNDHFAQDGIAFRKGTAWRWYALGPFHPHTRTFAPTISDGQRLESLLPDGEQAGRLHAVLNEIQMVLHASEVNTRRGQDGLRPINGVWLWGGGLPPQRVTSTWSKVFTDDPFGAALTCAAGLRPQPLREFESALGGLAAADSLLYLQSSGTNLFAQGQVEQWREWLTELEQRVFAPLSAMLRRGAVGQISLSAGRPSEFVVRRADRWRWWRKGPTLTALLCGSYS